MAKKVTSEMRASTNNKHPKCDHDLEVLDIEPFEGTVMKCNKCGDEFLDPIC